MRAGLPRVKQTELSRTCKDDKGWLYTKLRWPLLGASFCGSACTVYACVPPTPLHRACSSEIISGQCLKLKERKERKEGKEAKFLRWRNNLRPVPQIKRKEGKEGRKRSKVS